MRILCVSASAKGSMRNYLRLFMFVYLWSCADGTMKIGTLSHLGLLVLRERMMKTEKEGRDSERIF